VGKYSYPIIDCDGHVMEGFDFYEHYVEDGFEQAAREVVAKFADLSRGISRMVIGDAAQRGVFIRSIRTRLPLKPLWG
jgi:Fe-S oxidoreductase